MPTLELLTGPQVGMQWPLLGDRCVIGRETGCDIEIKETLGRASQKITGLSRKHSLITFDGGHWFIEDGDGEGRASRNHTFVNDKELPYPSRRRLRDQDRIRICHLQFVFHLGPEIEFSVEASVNHSDSSLLLATQPADRLRLLLDISAVLRGTLDADAVLDRTVEHLFKMFPQAERGLVVFREGPTGSPVLRTLRTPNGEPADPLFSSTVVRRCLESLEAILGNDLHAQFPESKSISALSSRSLICTPLWTPDGQALGVVQLDTRAAHRQFTPDDLRLLLGVASQASIALSNARLHHEKLDLQQRARDLEVAQQVQRSLLPRTLPQLPGYSFYAHYESAQEVGGDYYDFVPLPDGRLAVLLGDVSGKGVAAALVVAKFSVEARVCLENNANPGAAIDRLNTLMIRAAVPEKYVTLAVAVLDPIAHTVAVVNAGHLPPLLIRASGELEEVASDDAAGYPIGWIEGVPYLSQEVRLDPGDRLLMFSDGVSEAMGAYDRQFGLEGIRTAIKDAGASPLTTGERLLQAVKRHTVGCLQNDDITVVCFGRSAG